MKLYTKDQKSTFSYWFAHWKAYQKTAWDLGCWRFKYLLHDLEKPWLKLFWSYPKVQRWHRTHNPHHLLCYFLKGKADWVAIIIDWECSRFSKADAPLNAYQTFKREMEELENRKETNKTIKLLKELGVDVEGEEFGIKLRVARTALACVLTYLDLYEND